MGRLSKYKKVKSVNLFDGEKETPSGAVWGFGKSGRKQKKRSKTAQLLKKKKLKRKRERGVIDDSEGFDLPPRDGDEFNLSDFSVKKQKLLSLDDELIERHQGFTSGGLRCVVPGTNKEAADIARSLKVKDGPKEKNIMPRGKMEGESKNEFNRRVKNETRQIIEREAKEGRNSEKRQKKKDFLNSKKKKRGSRKQRKDSFDQSVDSDAFGCTLVTGDQAASLARAAFGEQAERPPVFVQLPRGALIKSHVSKKTKSGSMNESRVESERRAMEAMRKEVQSQYALIKARRKKAGEFHL